MTIPTSVIGHTQARGGMTLAAALKAEVRRRGATGQFFGHITYASLVITYRD